MSTLAIIAIALLIAPLLTTVGLVVVIGLSILLQNLTERF